MKMLHTCLRVKDLDASIAFYQEAFSLREERRKDFPDAQFTLVFLKSPEDPFEIELTYNYDRETPYELGDGYGHLAVGVYDLEASHQKHKEAGFEVTDLKGLPGSEPHFYFITDPDGYKTEVIRLT